MNPTPAPSAPSSRPLPPLPPASAQAEEDLKRSTKPHLAYLDIARDSLGRSPLADSSTGTPLATPRGISAFTSAPAMEILRSIIEEAKTPRLQWIAKDGEAEKVKEQQPGKLEQFRREQQLQVSVNWGPSIMSKETFMKQGCNVGSSPSVRKELGNNYFFPESFSIQYPQSEEVLGALEAGKVDRALLAVENSMHGTRHRTYDLLLRHKFHIVGELIQVHDHILESAAEQVITSRFWVLARDAILPTPAAVSSGTSTGKEDSSSLTTPGDDSTYKTTIALVFPDGLGSLHKVMAAFAFRGIHVTKVESRPWRHQPLIKINPASNFKFQYVVFVDFKGSTATRSAQNALSQLQQHSCFMRVLGSYPTITQSAPVDFPSAHMTPLASPRPVFVRT